MRVINDAVQDGVGDGGVLELVMRSVLLTPDDEKLFLGRYDKGNELGVRSLNFW